MHEVSAGNASHASYASDENYLTPKSPSNNDLSNRKKKIIIASTIVAVIVIAVVVVLLVLFLPKKDPKPEQPEVIINEAVSKTFDEEKGTVTLSQKTLKEYPQLDEFFNTLFPNEEIELVQVTEKTANRRRELLDTDIINELTTWFKEGSRLLPFLGRGEKRTLCGSTAGILKTALQSPHCCITYIVNGDFGSPIKKEGAFASDVEIFMTCDVEDTFNIKRALKSLNVKILNDASAWVDDIEVQSAGKLILSTKSLMHDLMLINEGITVISEARIARLPEFLRPLTEKFLKKNSSAIDFEMQLNFPFEEDIRIHFENAHLTVSTMINIDALFGDNIFLQRLRFESHGHDSFNIAARLRIRESRGATKYLLIIGHFNYGDEKTNVELAGKVKFQHVGRSIMEACIVANTQLDDVVGLIVELSGSNIGEVNHIVENLPKANLVMTLCNSKMVIDDMWLHRGLGIVLRDVSLLSDSLPTDLIKPMSRISPHFTEASWFVSFFMPVFDTGVLDWSLQVYSGDTLSVISGLEFEKVHFFVKVNGATLSVIDFSGVVHVVLSAEATFSYAIEGEFTGSNQKFSLSGHLLEEFTSPLGITGIRLTSSTCEMVISPTEMSFEMDTLFSLLYTEPHTEIHLIGSFISNDDIPTVFHFGTREPVEIEPLLPDIIIENVASFSGDVGVLFTNHDYMDTNNDLKMKRGLNIFSTGLRWRLADTEIGKLLSQILDASKLPRDVDNIRVLVPVFDNLKSISNLLSRREEESPPAYECDFSIPDIEIWRDVLVLENIAISTYVLEDLSEISIMLGSSLRVSVMNSEIIVIMEAYSVLSDEVQLIKGQATLPSWEKAFGLDWLRLGRSTVFLELSSAGENSLSMSSILEFGTEFVVKLNVGVNIDERGASLYMYHVNVGDVLELTVHVLQNVMKYNDISFILEQLEKTKLSLILSTYHHTDVNENIEYQVEPGINFYVDIEHNKVDCRHLTAEEREKKDNCEMVEISIIKEIVPFKSTENNLQFGFVLPIFSLNRRANTASVNFFIGYTVAIPLTDIVTLEDFKVSFEVVPARRRRFTEMESYYKRISKTAEGRFIKSRSYRRRSVSFSGEMATRVSLQINPTTKLYFLMEGTLVSSPVGVSAQLSGSLYGDPWVNAFGINGFTLHYVTAGLGLGTPCPPCLTYVSLGAKLTIADHTFEVAGALDIGVAPPLGYLKGSYTGDGTLLFISDFIEFVNVLSPNAINIPNLPHSITNAAGFETLTLEISNANHNFETTAVRKGFRFEGDMKFFGVDTFLKVVLVMDGIPDLFLDFTMNFANVNKVITNFTDTLKTFNIVPGFENVVNLILSFRLTRMSFDNFSIQQILKGIFPTVEFAYKLGNDEKTFRIDNFNFEAKNVLRIFSDSIEFPECVKNSDCPDGGRCFHSLDWNWQCRSSCPNPLKALELPFWGCFAH